jgi:hypothetical protein
MSFRVFGGAAVVSLCLASLAAGCSSSSSVAESSAAELRNLGSDEIVGSIALGAVSAPIVHPGTPRYRALRIDGKAGDVVDAWVRTADGDAMAFLLRADFKTLEANDDADASTKDAHITSTLDADGIYYIAFREHDFEPATFTVDLRGSKAAAQDGGSDGGSDAAPDVAPRGMDYGPSHTFAGLTGSLFVTQGGCSPSSSPGPQNIDTDAAYFCKHFYGDRLGQTCTAKQGYSLFTQTTCTDVKIHKNGGCTGQGTDIQGAACDTGACKIGNWNECTTGLTNLVCHCE